MDVTRMFAARPRWNYSPTMWLYKRIVEVALMEAAETLPDGTPSDNALLARDWIATSELESEFHAECQYISFPKVCDALGVNVDANRMGLLDIVDRNADFDTDDCWERLEALKSQTMADDEEPLYDIPEWARVVPAVDQCILFQAQDAAPRRRRQHDTVHVVPAARRSIHAGDQLALVV